MLKIIPLSAATLLLVSQPTQATEVIIDGPAITTLLTDTVLYGDAQGQPAEQLFQKSGATFYSSGGGQSQGSWKVEASQYCSAWPPNPAWVCYAIARDGDKVTFIAKSGKRTEMSLIK